MSDATVDDRRLWPVPRRRAATLPGATWIARKASVFTVADTKRFRATERGRMREAARHSMLLVVGVAALDTVWLVPYHPDATALVIGLNGSLALLAAGLYAWITFGSGRYPEVAVLLALVAVSGDAMILGAVHPDLALLAASYLLFLPMVVALIVPWRTKIHVGWLVFHAAATMAFAWYAVAAVVPAASRGGMFVLLVVSVLVSQFGHVSALRARVQAFTLVEQVRALNRQARRDRVRLDRLNGLLEQTATTDELTGLRNRLSLRMELRAVRSRIERHGERYGLLMIDLDRFKAVNDQQGHVAGDQVLRLVATTLKAAMRPEDGAYRYGGEEFVILLRIRRAREATVAAERIRHAIEAMGLPHPGNPPHGYVTACVGVTVVGSADLAVDDDAWFVRADMALYRAKALGRNRCEVAPAPVA